MDTAALLAEATLLMLRDSLGGLFGRLHNFLCARDVTSGAVLEHSSDRSSPSSHTEQRTTDYNMSQRIYMDRSTLSGMPSPKLQIVSLSDRMLPLTPDFSAAIKSSLLACHDLEQSRLYARPKIKELNNFCRAVELRIGSHEQLLPQLQSQGDSKCIRKIKRETNALWTLRAKAIADHDALQRSIFQKFEDFLVVQGRANSFIEDALQDAGLLRTWVAIVLDEYPPRDVDNELARLHDMRGNDGDDNDGPESESGDDEESSGVGLTQCQRCHAGPPGTRPLWASSDARRRRLACKRAKCRLRKARKDLDDRNVIIEMMACENDEAIRSGTRRTMSWEFFDLHCFKTVRKFTREVIQAENALEELKATLLKNGHDADAAALGSEPFEDDPLLAYPSDIEDRMIKSAPSAKIHEWLATISDDFEIPDAMPVYDLDDEIARMSGVENWELFHALPVQDFEADSDLKSNAEDLEDPDALLAHVVVSGLEQLSEIACGEDWLDTPDPQRKAKRRAWDNGGRQALEKVECTQRDAADATKMATYLGCVAS